MWKPYRKILIIAMLNFVILNTILFLFKIEGGSNLLISSIMDLLIVLYIFNYIKNETITPKNEEKKTENIYSELFKLLETMEFDIQQLRWHSEENVGAFNKIVKLSRDVEEFSEENAASTQEITAGINEFTEVSDKLKSNIYMIEESSSKSVEMLNQKASVIL